MQLPVAPDTGLHGLSEHERYFFETKGYLVVPDMLTPAQVDQMNEAIDQCPQLAGGGTGDFYNKKSDMLQGA